MRIRFRYQLRRSSSLFTVTTRIVFTVFILARFTTPGLTSTNLVFLRRIVLCFILAFAFALRFLCMSHSFRLFFLIPAEPKKQIPPFPQKT
jgi:hypothetical protein